MQCYRGFPTPAEIEPSRPEFNTLNYWVLEILEAVEFFFTILFSKIASLF